MLHRTSPVRDTDLRASPQSAVPDVTEIDYVPYEDLWGNEISWPHGRYELTKIVDHLRGKSLQFVIDTHLTPDERRLLESFDDLVKEHPFSDSDLRKAVYDRYARQDRRGKKIFDDVGLERLIKLVNTSYTGVTVGLPMPEPAEDCIPPQYFETFDKRCAAIIRSRRSLLVACFDHFEGRELTVRTLEEMTAYLCVAERAIAAASPANELSRVAARAFGLSP